MFIRTDRFTAIKRGFSRGFPIVVMAVAMLSGLAAAPAQATMPREVLPPAPRHHAPAIHHTPRNPAIQRTVISNTVRTVRDAAGRAKTDDFNDTDCPGPGVCEVNQDGSGNDSPAVDKRGDREAYLKKRKEELKKRFKALAEKKKKLKKEIAEIEKKFLKTKAGKKAQTKIDKERKKTDKKKNDVEERKKAKIKKENCCGYGEAQKIIEVFDAKKWKIEEEYEEARKDIIQDRLKKTDPKTHKKYEKARKDLKNASAERNKVGKELYTPGNWDAARVRP